MGKKSQEARYIDKIFLATFKDFSIKIKLTTAMLPVNIVSVISIPNPKNFSIDHLNVEKGV